MDFNFFDWIRNGVKQSVLLGVSDAVEQMGTPHEEEIVRNKILPFLQSGEDQEAINAKVIEAAPRRKLTSSKSEGSTRKLGRSIADIHPG